MMKHQRVNPCTLKGFAMANQMGNAMGGGAPAAAAPPAGTPPPPPGQTSLSFHISVSGQTYGPYDMNALQQMKSNGQFTAQSTVWREGMSGWLPASQVGELSSLFGPPPPPAASGSTPPPPPPPA